MLIIREELNNLKITLEIPSEMTESLISYVGDSKDAIKEEILIAIDEHLESLQNDDCIDPWDEPDRDVVDE